MASSFASPLALARERITHEFLPLARGHILVPAIPSAAYACTRRRLMEAE
jgi:hypothetical protein